MIETLLEEAVRTEILNTVRHRQEPVGCCKRAWIDQFRARQGEHRRINHGQSGTAPKGTAAATQRIAFLRFLRPSSMSEMRTREGGQKKIEEWLTRIMTSSPRRRKTPKPIVGLELGESYAQKKMHILLFPYR